MCASGNRCLPRFRDSGDSLARAAFGKGCELPSLPTSESSGLARGLSVKSFPEVLGYLVCTASALQLRAGWLRVPRDRELQGLFDSAQCLPWFPGLPRTVPYQIPRACLLVPDARRSLAPATEFVSSICRLSPRPLRFCLSSEPSPLPSPPARVLLPAKPQLTRREAAKRGRSISR